MKLKKLKWVKDDDNDDDENLRNKSEKPFESSFERNKLLLSLH